MTIPKGTALSVTLATPIASDTSKVEDTVRGTVAKAVVVSGVTLVPKGAEVVGTVVEANQSGRVKGRASIALQFDRVLVRDESYEIHTTRVSRQAEGSERQDVKKGGIGAAGGAIVGGVWPNLTSGSSTATVGSSPFS